MLERGVPILRKTEEIIQYFEPRLWFIENPQTGKMKDFIDPSVNFYDVDYCKYTDWGYRWNGHGSGLTRPALFRECVRRTVGMWRMGGTS